MLEDNKGLIAMSKEGQYRKCIAEKKRRKQENYYIKELAELLYEGFGDDVSLTSKSDKSAILERTIERIERVSNAGSGQCNSDCSINSSPKETIDSDNLGPFLLDALDGFMLIVDSEGKIVFVSDNVDNFIGYKQDDLIGKPIYKFIHNADHARFNANLHPTGTSSNNACDAVPFSRAFAGRRIDFTSVLEKSMSSFMCDASSNDSMDQCPLVRSSHLRSDAASSSFRKSSQFCVRFVLNSDRRKQLEALISQVGEKGRKRSHSNTFHDLSGVRSELKTVQMLDSAISSSLAQDVSKRIDSLNNSTNFPSYLNIQLYTVHYYASTSEAQSQTTSETSLKDLLVCIARRMPSSDYNPSKINVEQFSTKLDPAGKIISVDTTGLCSKYSQYLNKGLIGKNILHLCHPADVRKLEDHIHDTIKKSGTSILSPIYRLFLAADQYAYIQTKSRYFDCCPNQSFIALQNSIVRNLNESTQNSISDAFSE